MESNAQNGEVSEKRENENGTSNADNAENGEQAAKKLKTDESEGQIKVGVMPQDFPDAVLTTEQVEQVKEAILDKIVDMDESVVKPKFLRAINRNDYLSLTCVNEDTLTWLENEIASIKPWEDCSLKVMKGDSFPVSEIVYASLPKSTEYTTEKILKLIEGQNEGLKATSWRVISKSTGGSMVELVLKVNPTSLQKLKDLDYKVNYKFGTVRIGPKDKPKAPVKTTPKSTSFVSKPKPLLSAKPRFIPPPFVDRPGPFLPPRDRIGMGGPFRGGMGDRYGDDYYGAPMGRDEFVDDFGGPRGPMGPGDRFRFGGGGRMGGGGGGQYPGVDRNFWRGGY
ncbi:unnamed protein product [Callosobruchus maculatus]|uniref:DUF4780 domain-containing protein n=1 Tax=Callosobruchus maculatus TaxID=64391 RepID=A0A653CVY6_CALMS|nr:unnamed protein product [Callosobruchus maculatus]